jgi:hypothetical protein
MTEALMQSRREHEVHLSGVVEAVARVEAPPPLLRRAWHHKAVAHVVGERVVGGVGHVVLHGARVGPALHHQVVAPKVPALGMRERE